MPERKKKIILGGVVCLVLALLTVIYIREHAAKQPNLAPSSQSSIGVINLKQAMKEHPRYADLEKLRQERALLAASAAVKDAFGFAGTVPTAEDKSFTDAANQKAILEKNKMTLEYQQKLQDREQIVRAGYEAQKQAEKKSVSESYLNAIFNYNLKIDTAASLQLTAQQQDELKVAVEKLKEERGNRLRAIDMQYEKKVDAQIEPIRQQYAKELQEKSGKAYEEASAALAAKHTEAQMRNASSMQDGIENMTSNFAAVAKKKQDLKAKDQEVTALEESIIADIASKAAKFAILHHLEYVFADPFVNINAMDITDEVIEELKVSKK